MSDPQLPPQGPVADGAGAERTRGCRECGAPLDATASPGGLCPRCLLGLGLAPAAGAGSLLGVPERIGVYRVDRLLGEGGMGRVYLAEQEGPIRRRVAIKLIKLGMDTREVIARFAAERQALAMMSHANIATVFEAGATPEGRPYFALEYVDGVPITDFCDRRRLDVDRRLALFLEVCYAVQHAHQKGIIHRDLKPSNLLVELQNGKPVPKVIDFGIAKAISGEGGTEATALTRYGAWIGTPAYMSPEQADVHQPVADVRTDIYALGVVLYELLAGALPFDPERLTRAGGEEVRRILVEEEPPPPSARLPTLGERADEVARARSTERAALAKRLRGDLDWIVMKALAKEPARRYPAASELAGDVVRHLRHEPVVAGPPGVAYRLRKFVRRHRVAVAAATALIGALLAGVTGTSVGLARARRAERQASREAAIAADVTRFLVGLFQVSDPSEARGNSITAREILDRGARRIEEGLTADDAVRARLQQVMGTVYRELGLYAAAAPLLEGAVEILEREGGESPELASALVDLGVLLRWRGDFDRAHALLERSLEIQRGSGSPGGGDAGRGELAQTLKEMALLLTERGDAEAAEATYRESNALAIEVFGAEHPLVAWNLNDLANLAVARGDYGEAEPLYLRSLEIHEKTLGPDHHYVGNNLNNLANLYQYRGEYERALPLQQRALELHENLLGPKHPLVATSLGNLAVIHRQLGSHEAAEAVQRRALEIRESLLGPAHPAVALSLYHLANLRRDRGLDEAAEPLYRRALEICEQSLGAGHFQTAVVAGSLADLYRQRRDPGRAEPLFRRALESAEATVGPEHSRTAAILDGLGGLLAEAGRHVEAQGLLDRSLAIREALHARDPGAPLASADLASSHLRLGLLYCLRGEVAAARQAWQRALETIEPVTAGSRALPFLHLHARALLAVGRAEEARPLVDELLAKGWRHPALLEQLRGAETCSAPGGGSPSSGGGP